MIKKKRNQGPLKPLPKNKEYVLISNNYQSLVNKVIEGMAQEEKKDPNHVINTN